MAIDIKEEVGAIPKFVKDNKKTKQVEQVKKVKQVNEIKSKK